MNPSPLFLLDYFITDLSFSSVPDFNPNKLSEVFLLPEHLHIQIETWINENDPLNRTCKILIELKNNLTNEIPYIFSIALVGFFGIVDSWPSDQVERLFSSNAPALLYSAAREIIATTTGRGPYSKLLLPSVNFIQYSNSNTQEQTLNNLSKKDSVTKPSSRKKNK